MSIINANNFYFSIQSPYNTSSLCSGQSQHFLPHLFNTLLKKWHFFIFIPFLLMCMLCCFLLLIILFTQAVVFCSGVLNCFCCNLPLSKCCFNTVHWMIHLHFTLILLLWCLVHCLLFLAIYHSWTCLCLFGLIGAFTATFIFPIQFFLS